MPRKARITVPGCFHHIMARGIEGRDLFLDDHDRSVFVKLLEKYLSKSECGLYAWSLMPNHYHLVVQTGSLPLFSLMRPLNSLYAGHHSRKYERRGYLFQDRFKSIATMDQGYLKEMIRYVHANPLRAKICRSMYDLDRYPWTGHAAIMGKRKNAFQKTGPVLRRFGNNQQAARRKYREFMGASLLQPGGDLIETIRRSNAGTSSLHHSGCWVIGDPEFVRTAMADAKNRRIRLAKHARSGIRIDELAERMAKAVHLPVKSFRTRGRMNRASKVRKVFAFICRSEYEFPVTEIGRFLNMQAPPTCVSISQGAKIAGESEFTKILKRLRSE